MTLGQQQLLEALEQLVAGTQVQCRDGLALGHAAARLLYRAAQLAWDSSGALLTAQLRCPSYCELACT
jgi:hypothetical protein